MMEDIYQKIDGIVTSEAPQYDKFYQGGEGSGRPKGAKNKDGYTYHTRKESQAHKALNAHKMIKKAAKKSSGSKKGFFDKIKSFFKGGN